MKKTLSVLLSLLMLLSIISGLSFSASAGYQSGYSYDVINGNEAEITAYTGTEMTTFNIPSNFGDYTVTSIGDGAFSDNDYMQTLNIPATINNIGVQAFECCAALSGVYIQSASLTIGENAFFGCSSLVTVNLGDGVTSIGANAFANCSKLININIPNTLTSIDAGTAFDGCTRMSSINVAEGDPNYYSENGVLFGRNGIGGDVSMLKYPEGKEDTNYAIPAGVKTLRYGALRNLAKLETLSVPTSVKSINSGAVYNCPKLKDVYYEGTEAQWNAITIGTEENASLTNATMHFKSEPTPDPDPIVFPDVAEDAWYYEAVQYCAQKGFITGYANGKFGPADQLKRQDFVLILARIAGADLVSYGEADSELTDVVKGSYYAGAVNWAVANNIITGYDNGKFGVGDPITREQVATILYRYMGSPTLTDVEVTLESFKDAGSISSFAKNGMVWAIQNGVISGKKPDTLAPTATASRAEIATIIMRMDVQGMLDD